MAAAPQVFLAAASCDTKTRVYILGGQNRQTEHSRKIMLPTVPTITVLPDVSWSIMPQNMISYLKTESLLMILLDKSPKPTRNKTPKVTAGAANPPQEQMNQTCNCKESISTLRFSEHLPKGILCVSKRLYMQYPQQWFSELNTWFRLYIICIDMPNILSQSWKLSQTSAHAFGFSCTCKRQEGKFWSKSLTPFILDISWHGIKDVWKKLTTLHCDLRWFLCHPAFSCFSGWPLSPRDR